MTTRIPKSQILSQLRPFLDSHWNGRSPLLLGYSGGPDSKALLYALLECGVKNLCVAHVDHGWRPESGKEAEEIRGEVESLGLPFYSTRLKNITTEEGGRQERLAFFKKQFLPLHSEKPQALLLAHQAEDWAETALKRVLEGAHLPFLGGMEPVSEREGIPIWRPLLHASRSEILLFLKKRNLVPLEDPTNFDPAYLRARMRLETLPFINRSFGKQSTENLIWLARRAAELKVYLDRKIADVEVVKGPWGMYADLGGMERMEMRHFIQRTVEKPLPRETLERLLDGLEEKKPNRGTDRIRIDRGYFFLLDAKIIRFQTPFLLQLGKAVCGDWQVEVVEAAPCEEMPLLDWRRVWKGRFTFGWNPKFHKGSRLDGAPSGLFRKLWNEKKVPSFFRDQVPVLLSEGEASREFLSGAEMDEKIAAYKVTISYIANDFAPDG